jgi:hypothetical protein
MSCCTGDPPTPAHGRVRKGVSTPHEAPFPFLADASSFGQSESELHHRSFPKAQVALNEAAAQSRALLFVTEYDFQRCVPSTIFCRNMALRRCTYVETQVGNCQWYARHACFELHSDTPSGASPALIGKFSIAQNACIRRCHPISISPGYAGPPASRPVAASEVGRLGLIQLSREQML